MNNVDNPFKSPAVLSVCPGMLGLERGIERAIGRINTVAYVEIEAFIIENLVRQMEQGVLAPTPIWSNVKTFSRVANFFRGKIHGITGGYPCQPFSIAGEQRGTDDPRHLFPHISGIIETVRPVWCFFENVSAHLTLGFDEVYRNLSDLGYRVEAGIFTAEEVGAPHQRERLFILAIRRNWEFAKANSHRPHERGNTNSGESVELIKTSYRVQEKRRVGQANSPSVSFSNGGGKENNTSQGKEYILIGNHRGKKVSALADTCPLGFSGQVGNRKLGGIRFAERGKWPARPNEEQCEWEAPRVESGMGFTVNGYNYREDLLRMAGNGVVEQTAEIAFIILLNKHLK